MGRGPSPAGRGQIRRRGASCGRPADLREGAVVGWLAAGGRSTLRDWLFARQRYWGALPHRHDRETRMFPSCSPGTSADLPDGAESTGTGNPLAAVGTGRRQGDKARAGSCWYYLRFLDPAEAAGEGEFRCPWTFTWAARRAVLHLLSPGSGTRSHAVHRGVRVILGEVSTRRTRSEGRHVSIGDLSSLEAVAIDVGRYKEGQGYVMKETSRSWFSGAHKMSKSRGTSSTPRDIRTLTPCAADVHGPADGHGVWAQTLRMYRPGKMPLEQVLRRSPPRSSSGPPLRQGHVRTENALQHRHLMEFRTRSATTGPGRCEPSS